MKPIGSAWKLPPDRMSSPKISGLSDTPFTAAAEHVARVARSCARRRRTPAACSARRRDPARARSPRGCGGSRCRSSSARNAPARPRPGPAGGSPAGCASSNGAWLPARPSTVSAPADDRRVEQPLGLEQALERERQAQLRAVQQRETFLRLAVRAARRPPPPGRRCRPVERRRAPARRLAFADQRERHVRQRREIARRADRALRGHDRQHVRVQQREQHVGDERPRAGEAGREAVGLEQQHPPHDGGRQRRVRCRRRGCGPGSAAACGSWRRG